MQSRARRSLRVFTIIAAGLPWLGCASSGDGSGSSPGNTGGASFGGAAPSAGGSPPTSGGQVTSGGAAAAEGGSSTAAGGRVGTGGDRPAQSMGGTAGVGPGGRMNGGGVAGRGPGSMGGVTAGGATVTGGASSSAGAAGNMAVSGTAPSTGCGKATTLMNGRTSIDVSGSTREYILALPSNYDPNHPYRLIFGWHPLGGSAQQVASGGYYGLQNQSSGSAIFVAPEGLPFQGDSLGWGNKNGEDLAFLGALLERLRSELCIDENRIFSTGFSFGGMFSYAAGCWPDSMMRAIAPMAGNSVVSGCESGTRSVAMMGFHGTDDQVVAIDGGRKARDVFVQRNHCTQDTTTTQPSWCDGVNQSFQPCTCVSYEGCDEGYPVIWCEYKGQHMAAPSSSATIWNFFAQF